MIELRYRPPGSDAGGRFVLVAGEDGPDEQHFAFRDRIEVGRLEAGMPEYEGRLLIDDPSVSSRHCMILLTPDGRLYVRDTSRNGTRLDGTRLMPNREQEIRAGQTLSIGSSVALRLREMADEGAAEGPACAPARATVARMSREEMSVVVGDLRGYTSLVVSVPGETLQQAVSGVFARLQRMVLALGGQVKEFQGDSIMAFWEASGGRSPAIGACRAVLDLQREVESMAEDGTTWPFRDTPLRMDWAVTTGNVSVQVLGADRPEELSMVGEAVVLAYRLEKAANDSTGSPLICERTSADAAPWFEFRDVGELSLAGFDAPVRAYQLLGESRPVTGAMTRENLLPLR